MFRFHFSLLAKNQRLNQSSMKGNSDQCLRKEQNQTINLTRFEEIGNYSQWFTDKPKTSPVFLHVTCNLFTTPRYTVQPAGHGSFPLSLRNTLSSHKEAQKGGVVRHKNRLMSEKIVQRIRFCWDHLKLWQRVLILIYTCFPVTGYWS